MFVERGQGLRTPVAHHAQSSSNYDLAVLLDLGPDSTSSWRDGALCAQTDPEAFFPDKGGSTREAKKICSSCPVVHDCLTFALDNKERHGIWGGLSEQERRRLRPVPRERRPASIDHGTEAGYKAHQRAGEAACASCRAGTLQACRRRKEAAAAAVAPAPVAVLDERRDRPGVTRPWTRRELAETVRLLTDYGMTPRDVATAVSVPVARVRAALARTRRTA